MVHGLSCPIARGILPNQGLSLYLLHWQVDSLPLSNKVFLINVWTLLLGACQVALVAKSMPADAGGFRDAGSIPGSERSSGRGHGNSFQYSCQENPMDRGDWWAMVHSVAKVGHD